MKFTVAALAGFTLVTLSSMAPAHAVMIGAGTVASSNNFVPSVTLTPAPGTSTYTAQMGGTFQTQGTGSFAAVTGKNGVLNGMLSFSSIVGTVISQVVNDFLVFNDGFTGSYRFSVASVETQSYVSTAANNSVALYLLGTTLDAALGFEPTPTSLTVTINSTGTSVFSSSETLAIPPTAVPEPMSLALLGLGAIGTAVIRRMRPSA